MAEEKRGLPDHLTPGNPGNSGGKPGRSGRRPNALKSFLRGILEHPRYQRRIMRAALDDEFNVPLFRAMNEIVHGKAAQKVVVEGEVDVLVQNAYPGQGAIEARPIKQIVDPAMRKLALAEGVEIEEDLSDAPEDQPVRQRPDAPCDRGGRPEGRDRGSAGR